MGDLLGRLYSAAVELRGREKFSERHAEIFDADLLYTFQSSKAAMAMSYKWDWNDPSNAYTMMRSVNRSGDILKRLETMYGRLDKDAAPKDLISAIEEDIIDARGMIADCSMEIIGSVDEPSNKRSGVSRVLDIIYDLRYKIRVPIG